MKKSLKIKVNLFDIRHFGFYLCFMVLMFTHLVGCGGAAISIEETPAISPLGSGPLSSPIAPVNNPGNAIGTPIKTCTTYFAIQATFPTATKYTESFFLEKSAEDASFKLLSTNCPFPVMTTWQATYHVLFWKKVLLGGDATQTPVDVFIVWINGIDLWGKLTQVDPQGVLFNVQRTGKTGTPKPCDYSIEMAEGTLKNKSLPAFPDVLGETELSGVISISLTDQTSVETCGAILAPPT